MTGSRDQSMRTLWVSLVMSLLDGAFKVLGEMQEAE